MLVGLVSFAEVAMAVEEPAYRVIESAGDFEIRDYPSLIVAEVSVAGNQDSATRAGFRLLAGYIFGKNGPGQHIAMTAPVVSAPLADNSLDAMAVRRVGETGNWSVQFIMPRGSTLQSLPQPSDSRVRLRTLPPSKLAVLRFSGLAYEGDVIEKVGALRSLIGAHHLHAVGPVSLARYNPPWTPWFMRRNEVSVAVQ
jgi:hypothetical protein